VSLESALDVCPGFPFIVARGHMVLHVFDR
jgi:hypothetical protein